MLELVVEKGTGKVVKSPLVSIAGKTGTAQLNYTNGHGQHKSHQVSFCGYFPADEPQYSCIVVIREPRIGYPSGGTMSGGVFKNIAERIYAGNVQIRPNELPKDSLFLPSVKSGNALATKCTVEIGYRLHWTMAVNGQNSPTTAKKYVPLHWKSRPKQFPTW